MKASRESEKKALKHFQLTLEKIALQYPAGRRKSNKIGELETPDSLKRPFSFSPPLNYPTL